MKKIFLLFTVLIMTAACNKKIKETVGISTAGPNEYRVQRTKALEVPPHYYLPEPNTAQTSYDAVKGQDEFNDGEQALMQDVG